MAPTHWSFGQLASLVGAPAANLRQLPAPLAGINLLYGLTSHRAEQVKTLEIEDGRTELRAVTGPDYGLIHDHELVEAVQRISDVIGRKMTFLIVGIFAIIALPFLYLTLGKTTDLTSIVLCALAISFIGNAGYAPVLIFLNERFPTSLRASGTGLSWNIGFALGGMMPTFVSLGSAASAAISMTLAIFAGVIFLIYLVGAFVIPETRGQFD